MVIGTDQRTGTNETLSRAQRGHGDQMKRSTIYGLLVLCGLVAGGCFAFPRFVVFNNSAKEIAVHSSLHEYRIPPGRSLDIIDGTLTSEMAIKSDGDTWHYSFRYPPKQFRRGGLFRDTYLWQIEADGRVYVVGPGRDLPSRDHSGQPAGYPLTPRSGS